jgi:hypothetical protein
MPTPTDEELRASWNAEPKKRDWKGIAALITALIAAAGFVWNKVEASIDRWTANEVQKVSYDTLAETVNDLTIRLQVLERTCKPREVDANGVVDAVREMLTRWHKPELAAGTGIATGLEHEGMTAEMVTVEAEEEAEAPPEPEKDFPESGLPSFQAIQRQIEASPEGD